tara:strand:- start:1994 stop:2407 length:414 start_codon:yes stop_codon:yes gene_type:complete
VGVLVARADTKPLFVLRHCKMSFKRINNDEFPGCDDGFHLESFLSELSVTVEKGFLDVELGSVPKDVDDYMAPPPLDSIDDMGTFCEDEIEIVRSRKKDEVKNKYCTLSYDNKTKQFTVLLTLNNRQFMLQLNDSDL